MSGVNLKLRPWQEECLIKCNNWFNKPNSDRHFVINAAPGAGKTIAACAIAKHLFENNKIDNVIIIAPRNEVIMQWKQDFKLITGREMIKTTGSSDIIESIGIDVCATWSAMKDLKDKFSTFCNSRKVLVICDEHHHAAVMAAWGSSADSAFVNAEFALVLTGTPIRSDGGESLWLAYTDQGKLDVPEGGSYSLNYGKAVDLGYCRPATFHRHEGHFKVGDIENGLSKNISSKQSVNLEPKLKKIPGLERALDFYKLARTPQFEEDQKTPLVNSYQGSMLSYGSAKLDETRIRTPEAGGLVIAPNIEVAEHMAKLLEQIEGEKPYLVHSNITNNEDLIKVFRNSNTRWIVSVAMISEGVDIKRLRVLVYLPNALTQLAFVQATGRVVRTLGPKDYSRAYVIMPSTEIFEKFARQIESEIPPSEINKTEKVTRKICPDCRSECSLSAKNCKNCGYDFSANTISRTKVCDGCNTTNPFSAQSCINCGKSFMCNFSITLQEALREGAIVRGIDIDEEEVKEGERIASDIREMVFKGGEEMLIEMVGKLPDELMATMGKYFAEVKK